MLVRGQIDRVLTLGGRDAALLQRGGKFARIVARGPLRDEAVKLGLVGLAIGVALEMRVLGQGRLAHRIGQLFPAIIRRHRDAWPPRQGYTPCGAISGWRLPSHTCTLPFSVKSMIVSPIMLLMVSTAETSTNCPTPVRRRCIRATIVAKAAAVPKVASP